jgi:hypothetical protein
MLGKLASLRVSQLGEDSSTDRLLAEHAAVELAAGQPFLACNLSRSCHHSPSQKVDFVQDRDTSIP